MAALLEVGTIAPDFMLFNGLGEEVRLSDFRGKKVVLYFYPKDNTPGCTKQACGFRDAYADFKKADTVIIGISKDSVKSHANFTTKHALPFTLLSDPETEVCEMYGIWQLKKNYGREYMGIVRTTYIIDEQGTIVKVYPKVKVKEHIEKVLEDIKSLN